MITIPDRTGLITVSLGTTFLLASNVMGHGVGVAPDPRSALLLAATGLLFFVLAGNSSEQWREKFVRVLQLVLALGTFSVVAAFVVRDLQEFHQVASQDWGAIPPPQLIFAVTYTLASLGALLAIRIRGRRPSSEMEADLPATAD
jgi:xanthine/uracil/vitamin C permease (AzgA family)